MTGLAHPLLGLGLAIALGSAALAGQPVSLKSETVAQGKITLGDLFDGAGRASGVVVAPAPNPGGTMVLDAGLVQRAAMSSGLSWSNEQGVRRER
jgi:flagellar basal body P-ring formation protein FlgA